MPGKEIMTPAERAQRIVDKLYERNDQLSFETDLDSAGPIHIYLSKDGEDLGTIVVPEDIKDLCVYRMANGVEIEIVNLDFLEVGE